MSRSILRQPDDSNLPPVQVGNSNLWTTSLGLRHGVRRGRGTPSCAAHRSSGPDGTSPTNGAFRRPGVPHPAALRGRGSRPTFHASARTSPFMLELRTLGVVDLRTAAGREIHAVVRQPQRFGLPAWRALAAPGGFVRRDTLLGLFWPELDEEHARGALRRSLYFLRRALGGGDEVLIGRGDEEVCLAGERLWCDAVAFREAVKAEDLAGALALYQGDLLEGFYVAGAPEVGDWLDRERRRLREDAALAARRLARGSGGKDGGGDPAEQSRWARRALELDEGDEEMRSLLGRLRRAGVGPAASVPAGAAVPMRPSTDPRLLAICPFTVRGNPALEFLSEGMVDLLAARLDGAGDLRVVEPRLSLSGGGPAPAALPWTVAQGQELAVRAGAGGFVLGG